jgi:serine/threonine protein phosphatase PrpC
MRIKLRGSAEAAPPAKASIDSARVAFIVKGEDAMVSTVVELGDGWMLTLHAVFDGHGGPMAARHCAEHFPQLLCEVYAELSSQGERQSRLEMALIVTFERMDREIRTNDEIKTHGTTATIIVISEEMVTIANVGDSAAFLHRKDGQVESMIVDHRVESCSEPELKRVINGGAEIRQARDDRGKAVGPKRIFPGGLMMTRSIGDADASDVVIAQPAITQISYPPEGCTILMGSDGIWDFINLVRGHSQSPPRRPAAPLSP